MLILLIAVLITMWIIKDSHTVSKRISELRITTASASATAYSGLHHSLSSLKSWVLLGSEEYKVERALAWQEEISPSIETLTSLSENWTDPKNRLRLKKVKTLLIQFKAYQQQIEDIANTTNNEPALDLLLSQVIPLADTMYHDISQVINLEEKQKVNTERKKLFSVLTDMRGSFSSTLASIQTYLLSGDTQFKTKTITLWDQQSQSFNSLQDKISLFSEKQKTAFNSLTSHRAEFEVLWPKILAMREQTDWNLSRYWLAKKAAPISAEIGQILLQIKHSQSQLLKEDQKQIDSGLNNLIMDEWILLLFGFIVSTLMSSLLSKNIKDQVGGEPPEIMNFAKQVAEGRIDMPDHSDTTTGILSSLYLIANAQKKITHHINMIATGDFTVDVTPRSDSDALAISMQGLIKHLHNITHAAKTVAEGNFDIQLKTQEKNDALGKAMQQMIKNLRLAADETGRTAWLQKGQVLVAESLREEQSVQTLGENLLKTISTYTNAQIGTIYQWVNENKNKNKEGYLELTATYAYTRRKQIKQRFQLGESLVGQAAKENKIIIVEQVPEGYIQISSSLGETTPQNLILVPFSFHDQLRGVLELGFIQEIDDQITALLTSIIDPIGVSFENINYQIRLTTSLRASVALESEIRSNEQRISKTMESVLVSVVTITTRGIIESCNATTEKFFGYRKDEMIGNNVKMLMPESRAVQHDSYLKNYQQTSHAKMIGLGREVVAKRKDGSEFPIHLSVSELQLDETMLYLGTITDISEQVKQREKISQSNMELQASAEELASQQNKLSETNETLNAKTKELEQQKKELEVSQQKLEVKASELEASSRYKSEFLANMSHELRTPLNSLLILSKFLADNDAKNLSEDEVESAQVIHESGSNLLQLINDILDLSKVEAGHMTLHTDAILLTDLQHFINSRFKHMAEAKDIFFKMEIHANVPARFISDYTKLGQVLTNLISNALKFTKNGSVTLAVSLEEIEIENHQTQWLSFTVIDTGIGIPLDAQNAIFEAFQQADGSTNRQFGGTGLGLSIASSFTKLLGGQIAVESKVDKGSQFTLKIPYIKPSNNHEVDPLLQKVVAQSILPIQDNIKETVLAPKEDNEQVKLTSLKGKQILLVDDDMRNTFSLAKVLHSKGLNVRIAPSGQDALNALDDQTDFDLILMDIMMPDMDGYETIRRIRKQEKFKELPIVALTANAMQGDNKKCIAAGADDYQIKPVDLEKLFIQIQKWL